MINKRELEIKENFNLQLIPETLKECSVFTTNELEQFKFAVNTYF